MRFIDACLGRPVDTTPLWIMRQAGRYLPEYRDLRSRADFLAMCRTPELAAEATMQPMRRFDLDAAVIFSDILIPVAAMGVPVEFLPEPRLPRAIRTRADVAALQVPDPVRETPFTLDAIRQVRAGLEPHRALIGFAGAPFTLAAYLVQGGGSKEFLEARAMMHRDPTLFRDLLERIADAIAPYLSAQIDAGANAVQIFESWAAALSPEDFEGFALPVVRSIIERVRRPGVPVIYFVNGCAPHLKALAGCGADVIGVDFRIRLADAIAGLGPGVSVQGNLDPSVLLGTEPLVRERAAAVVAEGRAARGHVFNLGHGITPATPVENVAALVETVHSAGRR